MSHSPACHACEDGRAHPGMPDPTLDRLAAALDRQWFYDGLPPDADDDLYALADSIFASVRAALSSPAPEAEPRAHFRSRLDADTFGNPLPAPEALSSAANPNQEEEPNVR